MKPARDGGDESKHDDDDDESENREGASTLLSKKKLFSSPVAVSKNLTCTSELQAKPAALQTFKYRASSRNHSNNISSPLPCRIQEPWQKDLVG